MKLKQFFTGLFFLVICGIAAAQDNTEPERNWRTRFGGKLNATWDKTNDSPNSEFIRLLTPSRAYRVRISDLILEDRQYVEKRRKADPVFTQSEAAEQETVPTTSESVPSRPVPEQPKQAVKDSIPVPTEQIDHAPIPTPPEQIVPESIPDPMEQIVPDSVPVPPEQIMPDSIPEPSESELVDSTSSTPREEMTAVITENTISDEIPATDSLSPKSLNEQIPENSDLSTPGTFPGEKRSFVLVDVVFPFRWCPSGTFLMGSPAEEQERDTDEQQHEVTITKGFWMLETEVTQQMWSTLVSRNPSWFSENGSGAHRVKSIDTSMLPVEQVTWDEAVTFCSILSDLTGYHAALPTEAEWEYACRAGTTTPYSLGIDITPELANYDDSTSSNPDQRRKAIRNPFPVAEFPPNEWGIYDMHGNIAEWCRDRFLADFSPDPVTDPQGPETGKGRVCRGGSWFYDAGECRSASRYGVDPEMRSYGQGFRFVIEP